MHSQLLQHPPHSGGVFGYASCESVVYSLGVSVRRRFLYSRLESGIVAVRIGARVSEHERVGAIAVFFARVAQLRDSGR